MVRQGERPGHAMGVFPEGVRRAAQVHAAVDGVDFLWRDQALNRTGQVRCHRCACIGRRGSEGFRGAVAVRLVNSRLSRRDGSRPCMIAVALIFCAGIAEATPARIQMVQKGEVAAADMTRLAREAHDAAARVDGWLGLDASAVALRCDVYPTLEAKGLATSYTLPAHSVPDQNLVVCSAETGFEGELGREV